GLGLWPDDRPARARRAASWGHVSRHTARRFYRHVFRLGHPRRARSRDLARGATHRTAPVRRAARRPGVPDGALDLRLPADDARLWTAGIPAYRGVDSV